MQPHLISCDDEFRFRIGPSERSQVINVQFQLSPTELPVDELHAKWGWRLGFFYCFLWLGSRLDNSKMLMPRMRLLPMMLTRRMQRMQRMLRRMRRMPPAAQAKGTAAQVSGEGGLEALHRFQVWNSLDVFKST